MLAQEVIRRKRDGGRLSPDEIAFMMRGLVDGSVTDSQAAALAMAIFLRGMEREEIVALTLAMRDSGNVLDWHELDRPVVDKHSTGGVGDNVSLMLAPALAACGAAVPMISGRGLGHTGGTLDKLDSIPGYVSQPEIGLFRKVVRDIGCAVIGQTEDLAPADKRLYAIRDVTATVESLPLITASILSKKFAAGLGVLTLDVKTGSGAFMPEMKDSLALAESLVDVANQGGMKTSALITDMDQPLASAAGNAVEVRNAVDFLTGRARDERLWEVTIALGGETLAMAGLSSDADHGRTMMERALHSGRAAEHFARMVVALGGPADFIERMEDHLPKAPIVRDISPERGGRVVSVECRGIGLAVIELGGGRRRAADPIDHSVGFSRLAEVGEEVGPDRPLGVVHARDEAAAERAEALLRAAYEVGDTAPERGPTVIHRIG